DNRSAKAGGREPAVLLQMETVGRQLLRRRRLHHRISTSVEPFIPIIVLAPALNVQPPAEKSCFRRPMGDSPTSHSLNPAPNAAFTISGDFGRLASQSI